MRPPEIAGNIGELARSHVNVGLVLGAIWLAVAARDCSPLRFFFYVREAHKADFRLKNRTADMSRIADIDPPYEPSNYADRKCSTVASIANG